MKTKQKQKKWIEILNFILTDNLKFGFQDLNRKTIR